MTLDITTLFLALGVVFGAIVALLQVRMTHHYLALAARQQRHERTSELTKDMLVAWVLHGQWPPGCQEALLDVLRKHGVLPSEPPPATDAELTPTVGMDYGIGLVLEGMWSRLRGSV